MSNDMNVIKAEFVMTTEQGVGWCLIPPEVMERSDLSANAKLIIGRINGLRGKEGYCYASNKWLGDQIGIKAGTVSNIISSLVKKNFIQRELKRNENGKIVQRRLYPLSIREWIPINSRVEGSNREDTNRVNNDNGFSYQKSSQKRTNSIRNYLQANSDIAEDTKEAILYYLDTYKSIVGKSHPNITLVQFQTIVEGFETEIPVAGSLDLNNHVAIIDSWFSDKYVKSDYNILHFVSGEIISQHYFKSHM